MRRNPKKSPTEKFVDHPCQGIDCCTGDDTYQDTSGRWLCGFCLLEEHNDAVEQAEGLPFVKGDASAPREADVGCGCERAGIGIFNEDNTIQRCDDCALFEGDDDAAGVVDELLQLLHLEFARYGGTVADAVSRLVELHERKALKIAEAALAEGFENTGSAPDSAFAESLIEVRRALATKAERTQDEKAQVVR